MSWASIKYQKYLIFTLFFLLIGIKHAQAQVADSTMYLDEVEVIDIPFPERASFKATYIPPEVIESNLTASLGEMLSLHTPIFIKSYGAGGTATPSFRGTGASHTQVYWNGINLNSPMLGQVDLSLFPVAFTDEVVVNYGASSLLYGTGGLGGAIQMNSVQHWDSEPHILVSQSASTLQNYTSNMSVSLGSEKLQSTTKVYYKSAQNEFDFVNPTQPDSPTWTNDHSAQEQYGILQELSAKIGEKQKVSVHAWYQSSERELAPSMDKKDETAIQGDNSLRLLGVWGYYDTKKSFEFNTAYINDTFDYYRELTSDTPPKIDESESSGYTIQSHFKANYKLSNQLSVRGGLDFQLDQIESSSFLSEGTGEQYDVTQNMFDVYASLEWTPRTNFNLNFLVRQEWIDEDAKPFLPSLGADWTFLNNDLHTLGVKANISRNFHAPTLNDKYRYPVGNPDLKEEQGWSQEFGFNYLYRPNTQWLFRYEATAYFSVIDNWIVWQPRGSGLWEPFNLKEVYSRGIEQVVNAVYQENDWKVDLFASFSYVKSENQEAYNELDNSVGTQLIYTPVTSLQAYARVKYKSFFFTIEEQAYGERYIETDGTEWLPPYYLTNLAVGKQFKTDSHRLDAQLRIENLFGYHYQSIARKPMPGRVAQFSLTYHFN